MIHNPRYKYLKLAFVVHSTCNLSTLISLIRNQEDNNYRTIFHIERCSINA